ncbi:thioredoxin domain-containing protein [Vibrio cholerae]|nr:thioredoxin domain-containing protein [Vibrio cholerae]
MNPWFAAMIPLSIILVLGSIAFFIGFKGYLSNDDGPQQRNLTKARPTTGSSGSSTAPQTDRVDSADPIDQQAQQALRVSINASNRLTLRASHERAVLVQYIDLFAPGTLPVQEFLSNLRTDYSRRVTFVARHLPSDKQAHLGAAALEAADRQGRFIPFLEALTLNRGTQGRLTQHAAATVDTYLAIARDLRLDTDRFATDMGSSEVQELIEADRQEAVRAGVSRAPALILLDDQNHNALTSLDDFREAVRLVAT